MSFSVSILNQQRAALLRFQYRHGCQRVCVGNFIEFIDGCKIRNGHLKKKTGCRATVHNHRESIAMYVWSTVKTVLTVALRGLHKQNIRTVRHVLMHKLVDYCRWFSCGCCSGPRYTKMYHSYSLPAHLLTRFFFNSTLLLGHDDPLILCSSIN